jgi:hypothetical protein
MDRVCFFNIRRAFFISIRFLALETIAWVMK